ncbi:MAG: IgGFc-binding protein, partial [Myxococcales bacterium]|nr:IgGFc-binding protein [Myxococcales bacterium]
GDGDGDGDADCICTPGEYEAGVCIGEDLSVCADDCMEYVPEPCGPQSSCVAGICEALFCSPGVSVCMGDDVVTCNDQGSDYLDPVPCGDTEGCELGQCFELCSLVAQDPSSVGCSFIANRMDNFNNSLNDSLIVGNTSPDKTASVQLYFTPNNTNNEQAQGGAINVGPGQTHEFALTNTPFDDNSGLRVGGSYRVESNIPIIAYQHSPLQQQFTNDASMLLPEHAMRSNHVIASYANSLGGTYPSYFNVIALEDNTTVNWTPRTNTLAGGGVPAVNANQTGMVMMNRFDTLQVRVQSINADMSGTYVTGNGKKIWVIGATECVNVPANVTYCDHIEEQMIPLDYWGSEVVAAHSPDRGNEKHHFRVYAGEDDVMIMTNPPQPGTPFTLTNQGDFQNIVVNNNTSFVVTSDQDKPFLVVQYLESTSGGAGTGDPSMYQMVPTQQFLSSYAFVTGNNYPLHYVQITRAAGGADVMVDGQTVNGYYQVGNYEVADWQINEGSHFATSNQPFGIVGVGYSAATSYAYPGGLKLETINPQ